MRSKALILEGSPCDLDFTDKTMQTASDFKSRPKVLCTNHGVCNERNEVEGISCYRLVSIQVARYVFQSTQDIEKAMKAERQCLENEPIASKFWVLRDGVWQVVEGTACVLDEIMGFARTIIDFQPGERQPFTRDGMILETGPKAAFDNAMRDLDDVYGEVGARNPFR